MVPDSRSWPPELKAIPGVIASRVSGLRGLRLRVWIIRIGVRERVL